MSGVRVIVDAELCMASGTCVSVAPDLFDMGDDGTAIPLRPVEAGSHKVHEAVTRCPTGAIRVTASG